MVRPEIGVPMLLVYRECPCGEWCATGEGAVAPLCNVCGEMMLPGGGPRSEDRGPMFGASFDEARRLRGLGFRAVLANEIAIAEGQPIDVAVDRAVAAHGIGRRFYLPEEVQRHDD